jgi:hypothetical protein
VSFSNRQIVAILAILVGGIIAAHKFAPAGAGEIVSIAVTVIGVLFVNRDKGPPSPPAGGTGSPDLKVIAGGLGVFVLGCAFALSGCLGHGGQIEAAALGDPVSDDLKACRHEARDAYYDAGKPVGEALKSYEACKADAGIK